MKIILDIVAFLGRSVHLSELLALASLLWLWLLCHWVCILVLCQCRFCQNILPPFVYVGFCQNLTWCYFSSQFPITMWMPCHGLIHLLDNLWPCCHLWWCWHFLRLRKMESNFHWKTSLETVALNGITVNLNQPISVLKVVKKLDSSSRGWCQYPLEQSSTVMTVAPASLCAMSSGVQKELGSWMIALLRLVGSKQIQSFGLPVLLSVDSTKMKLFIHGVASGKA